MGRDGRGETGATSARAHTRIPTHNPQPANPIMESEKCRAYIIYSCKECIGRCKVRVRMHVT